MKDLLVVSYAEHKAIIRDEFDQLYYLECEPNESPIGTVVEETGVFPFSTLSIEEQEKIIKQL